MPTSSQFADMTELPQHILEEKAGFLSNHSVFALFFIQKLLNLAFLFKKVHLSGSSLGTTSIEALWREAQVRILRTTEGGDAAGARAQDHS